jgi:glucose/arabinose dehydrogenase|tara:strand:+ start:340 stop:798 length:459 start_codon:yes stop_codon:yes gene_type:complete
MKNGGKKLNETLDNLIVESEQTCAPTADAVLALVRQEKTARSRRQAAAALTVLALAITSIVLLQPDRTETQQTIAQTSPAEPVPSAKPPKEPETTDTELNAQEIDDAHLLEMLGDQSVALVTYPDGSRQLMLITESGEVQVFNKDGAYIHTN